jgi:hypothetical protein
VLTKPTSTSPPASLAALSTYRRPGSSFGEVAKKHGKYYSISQQVFDEPDHET